MILARVLCTALVGLLSNTGECRSPLPIDGVVAGAGWGVDACITRHVPEDELPAYIELLKQSGVRIVQERDVGREIADGSYQNDVRAKFRTLKAAGFYVVAYASLPELVKPLDRANALPEDLLKVFRQGEILAHDFAGLVDAWELLGEPDVGYCTDLPDRAVAYQKALYLGIKVGAAELRGGPPVESAELKVESGKAGSGNLAVSDPSTLSSQHSTARAPLVLMGALALPPGPWLERAMKNGLLDYTDAYNFHFYGHAEDLARVIAAHSRAAKRVRSDDRRRTTDDGSSSALDNLSSILRRLVSVFRPPSSGLPLWITECGINAVPSDDFLNPERRRLQADFTVKTAEQARAARSVAVFMPFILAHEKDPHAMTLSAARPLPAWNAYAQFTREHVWPARKLAAPPSSPNPIVLQWLPDNATAQAHKVSGSYRFMGHRPIKGELRLYNFSDRILRGRLSTENLHALQQERPVPASIELAPMSSRSVALTFVRGQAAGYVREEWGAEFRDESGGRSRVAFALETTPGDEAADFSERPLALASVGASGSAHRFDPGDVVTIRGAVWQGVNGLQVKELPTAPRADATLQISVNEPRRDPLRAKLAVARLVGGLPASGFIRLRLDRPMDRDFKVCVDLVDRLGQRFSIWENMGVSYFRPHTTDVWLNLADFAPYFWGRCTADPRFHPAEVEEIQLRFYISKANDPREVSLAFMQQRD